MNVSGWIAKGAPQEYDGTLVRGADVREADNAQVPDKNAMTGEPAP